MKIENTDTQQQLIQRLARIEGQLRGLQTMLREERDCREILQQLTAANAALQSASRVFLQDYAALCLARMDADQPSLSPSEQETRRAELVNEMLTLLGKAP